MSETPHVPGPVVIGGVGGSGTRVVARIVAGLGYDLGYDLNAAGDNLWFTLLFKRPRWYRRVRGDGREIHRGLDILANASTSRRKASFADRRFVLRAAVGMALTGHNPRGSGRGLWPLIRARRMLGARRAPAASRGWGWKEPNSHVYLDFLAEHFPELRYIHTIRHGVDMAFSRNQQQLHNWGPVFGIDPPRGEAELPVASLRFWVRVHRRVSGIGARLPEGRFHLVNFDRLCSSPRGEVEGLMSFLGVEGSPERDTLAEIPRVPESMGRYRDHDLTAFDREDLDAVRAFGFSVEP